MKRLLLGAVLAIAVAATAMSASFALLGYATPRSDPVGRLSPGVSLVPVPAPTRVLSPRVGPNRQPQTPVGSYENDSQDD